MMFNRGAQVVIARLGVSPYSIRHTLSYQVAASYPLPPPSTIMGAIAKALAYFGYCKDPNDCLKVARSLIAKVRAAVTSKSILSKNSIILSRIRKVLEDKKLPKSLSEFVKFRDAMLREYVFTTDSLLVLVVPRASDPQGLNRIVKTLYLVDRLGDSESLVAIENVQIASAHRSNSPFVNVVVKADVVSGGNYIVMKGPDENGNAVDLAFPVARSFDVKGEYYVASSITVKQGLDVICANEVCFPSGGDW